MSTVVNDANRYAVAEINIIPLADVLLVLLIIFMVTAPMASRTISMDLPKAAPESPLPASRITLRIDAAGDVYRDGALVPAPALQEMLAMEVRTAQTHTAARLPQLRADASDAADYQAVATVLAAAQHAGLSNIALSGGG